MQPILSNDLGEKAKNLIHSSIRVLGGCAHENRGEEKNSENFTTINNRDLQ